MQTAVLANAGEAYNLDMQSPFFQILSQQPDFPVERMEFDDLKLVFNVPYVMTVKREGEYLVHENMRLNLVVSGKDFNELAEEFFDAFRFLWNAYALAEDNTLSQGARELKQALLVMLRAE